MFNVSNEPKKAICFLQQYINFEASFSQRSFMVRVFFFSVAKSQMLVPISEAPIRICDSKSIYS